MITRALIVAALAAAAGATVAARRAPARPRLTLVVNNPDPLAAAAAVRAMRSPRPPLRSVQYQS